MNEQADFDSLLPPQSINRRVFLAAGVGAGFALAVQPVVAQTVMRTDAQGLLAGEVSVPVGDGDVFAYRARPEGGGKAPVVLVVSEIFGVHEYIQDICRRLAKLGYFAIAPELFRRQGDPSQIASIPEIQAKITSKTPDAQVFADLDACAAWAAGQGGDNGRLAIAGFCWGGRIAWLYAAMNPQVKAGVAWYGRLVGLENEFTPRHPLQQAGALKAPVLGLYGGQDPGISLETVKAMEKALQQGSPAAQASVIQVYDNAPHAFHADYRPSFRKDEAEDGWRRMLGWLHQHGV